MVLGSLIFVPGVSRIAVGSWFLVPHVSRISAGAWFLVLLGFPLVLVAVIPFQQEPRTNFLWFLVLGVSIFFCGSCFLAPGVSAISFSSWFLVPGVSVISFGS